jgi:hypothetical protein
MRRFAAVLGALALVAGCASSGSTSPSPATTPASTSIAGSTATPASTAALTPTAAKAKVTFDGSTCAYSGGTVFPLLTTLTITYEPTPAEEGSWVGIFAVHSDATQADFDNPANPDIGDGTPSWVYEDTAAFAQGASVNDYSLTQWQASRPYDTYMVTCVHAIPGRPPTGAAGYTLLHVVDSTASTPAPTAAP